MGQIHLLDETLANQIAAGEVVERPASVVKELVENAVDAGGTEVLVEIANGGTDLIRVVDNGSGMDGDDMRMCLLRHATSKLRQISDLNDLRSLGFRGEAIPSIASVSKFSIRSRQAGEVGARLIRSDGGAEPTLSDVGGPVGTEVRVADLFFNVPARRKFLKTPATEASHVKECLQRLALCYPQISIKFIKDGRQSFHYPASPNLRSRIGAAFGHQLAERLRPVSVEGGFGLDGFIGDPRDAKSTPRHYHIFINGRFVRDRVVMSAIQAGYRTSLIKGKHPFVVLRLRIPSIAVDVNVHPAKTEVRFSDTRAIHRLVARAVEAGLSNEEGSAVPSVGGDISTVVTAGSTPTNKSLGVGGIAAQRARIFDAMEKIAGARGRSPAPRRRGGTPREAQLPLAVESAEASPGQRSTRGSQPEPRNRRSDQIGAEVFRANPLEMNASPLSPSDLESLYDLSSVSLFRRGSSLVGIRRHAVLRAFWRDGPLPTSALQPQLTIELTPEQVELIGRLSDGLVRCGFGVEVFGESTARVSSVPQRLTPRSAVSMLRAFLSNHANRSVDDFHIELVSAMVEASAGAMTGSELVSLCGPFLSDDGVGAVQLREIDERTLLALWGA